MTKEYRAKARNAAYEGMLAAQALIDEAVTERDMVIATSLYRCLNGLYWVLVEDEKREKRETRGGGPPHPSAPPAPTPSPQGEGSAGGN